MKRDGRSGHPFLFLIFRIGIPSISLEREPFCKLLWRHLSLRVTRLLCLATEQILILGGFMLSILTFLFNLTVHLFHAKTKLLLTISLQLSVNDTMFSLSSAIKPGK